MSSEDRIREDGLGEDKLFKTHKNLNLKWQWSDIMHTPNSSQVSLAKFSGWDLEAVHWHSSYEAVVEYYGEKIIRKEGLKTRLEAQIEAERLLLEWLKGEYLKIKKRFARK